MTQLGLSSLYMFGMAFVILFSFLAVEFGLFVKPEHRVTTMNGPWSQAASEDYDQAALAVSFKA
ncbi:hypothetical protein [Vibrio sp. HN007]|uniref:hypothetical protein n=1 Tax=Vibrio iocasae TaxID=3098914 RepID=UPI0035D401B3